MTEFAELLEALASLAWPTLAFYAVYSFRDDIVSAIGRIKKAKVLGHKLELRPQLEELHEAANQASTKVAELPLDIPGPDEKSTSESDHPETEVVVRNVLETATQSPRAALILLAIEVEKEGREVLAIIGKWREARPLPILRVIERLDSHYGLPKLAFSSLKLFLDTRNKIVHGGFAVEQDIVSAIDSGVTVYRVLKSLPRERNWVYHEGVPVHSDQECLHEIPGVKGIILKTESSSGAATMYRIFSSTRTYFEKGKRVSWEWNLAKTWSDAWYRDPDSNQVKLAWNSSGEFIGRHFDDL